MTTTQTIFFAITLVATVFGIFRLLQDYVRRSIRSLENAARVWNEIPKKVEELIDSGVSANIARISMALMGSAGCGCYVRGMLMSHYLPRWSVSAGADSSVSQAFDDLKSMTIEQEEKFDRLLSFVIVYDSFSNPLQGWLFRRMLASWRSGEPSFGEKLEAQLTAFSILSSKGFEDRVLPILKKART